MMIQALPQVPSNDPTRFCRLCFSQRNIHWVIRTNGTSVDQPFVNTIGECLGVWLKLDEDFPCAVCRLCTTKLERIIEFRESCRLCDAALQKKRQEDPEAMVLFYDYPEDKVYINGAAKPGFFQDDSDFENEAILPEVVLSVENKPASQSAKELALKSYFESYATWTAEMAITKDDDEMTVMAPEALEQQDSPNQLVVLHEQYVENKPIRKVKQMSPVSQNWCCLCKRNFRTSTSLKRHIAEKHFPEGGGFKCTECGKKFVSYFLLKSHALRHQGSLLINCDKCGIQFLSSQELEAHRKTDGCKTAAFGRCKYCDRSFSRRGRYIFHLKQLHPDKPLPRTIEPLRKRTRKPVKYSRTRKPTKPPRKILPNCSDRRIFQSTGTARRVEQNGRFVVMLEPLSQDTIRTARSGTGKTSEQRGPNPAVTGLEEVVCTLCFEQFGDLPEFRAHLEQCFGTGDGTKPPPPYMLCRCGICTGVFDEIGQFLQHLRQHERPYQVKPHDCVRCLQWTPPDASRPPSPLSILGE